MNKKRQAIMPRVESLIAGMFLQHLPLTKALSLLVSDLTASGEEQDAIKKGRSSSVNKIALVMS